MIISCPDCGEESGVTHGDQVFEIAVCDLCKAYQAEIDAGIRCRDGVLKTEHCRYCQRRLDQMIDADIEFQKRNI